MHYISADSLWFCSNFYSVLIVMQVVAMGLCFGDDAICCVFVNYQTEACLDLKQHNDAVNSPSGPLTTRNNLKNCFYQKLAKVFSFHCSQELSENKDKPFCWTSCKDVLVPLRFIFAPSTTANTKCWWSLITPRWTSCSSFYPAVLRSFLVHWDQNCRFSSDFLS